MQIREIMTRDVQIASPDDTVKQAARMMSQNDIGALPVGENDRLVGMVTDRDIAVRAVAEGKAPDTCKIREIMTPDVKYVFEDESAEDVARNMGGLQMRRLPVLDRDKRLVGIVSLGDLAVEPPAKEKAKDALSEVSKPAHH